MNGILVYLFPMLMDFILSGILFISACRFSEQHAAPWVVGATMGAWAVIYSLLSFLNGLIVRPQKAIYFVIGSGLGIALVSLGFITFDGLYLQFLWIALSGVAVACFFGPFQMYMKLTADGNEPAKADLIRPTALYTGSWSLGFALGPLVFGHLAMATGFRICIFGGFALCIGTLVIERRRQRRLKTAAAETEPVKTAAAAVSPDSAPAAGQYSRFPNLVLIGWLIGTVGGLAIALLRTLGPFRGITVLHLNVTQMGNTLFLLSLMQSITAFLLIFSKDWMYRRIPAILMNGLGIVALLLFGLGTSYGFFLAGAFLFGIYSGCFYFFFVFHSLVHPERSAFYVSVNECIVGATGLVGPILSGALVTERTCGIVFIIAAAAVAAALVVQLARGGAGKEADGRHFTSR